MELYDAIIYRKSTRKYSPDALTPDELQAVRAIIDTAEKLYSNIEMTIHLVENGPQLHDLLPGVIGSYGRVKAPHYLIVSSEQKEGFQQNIGFTLQGIVLALTTMGLATCWLGGTIKDGLLDGIIGIPEGQSPQLMVAFGYPAKGKSPFRRSSSEAKRKDISEITSGSMDITWSRIVSAVRLAPSAVNNQPWRLVFKEGKVNVYSARTGNFITKHLLRPLNLIGIGIALCHAMVAARHFSRNIRFTKDCSAAMKDMEYVTTIIEI
ncbi:MAG TPA: nitroreductase family protein [Candidatus Nitrosocosmicus sp.]|nr:nitroreductase family protein [Candidatus Nitrosocosmicus sp.]